MAQVKAIHFETQDKKPPARVFTAAKLFLQKTKKPW
jgi:hypothetical protein